MRAFSMSYAIMWSTVKRLSEFFVKNEKITNAFSQNVISVSSAPRIESISQEQKCQVDGIDINYLKIGKGDHPLLLLPGAMGSIWTDFKPQIENLDKEKFTIIAWDPPGYGKSRPPDRTFPVNFYRRDASWARNLMKNLSYNKFSLLGWSDGGTTSLILAADYPDNVRKMIVTSGHAYFKLEELEQYESLRNIDTWSEKLRAPMIAVYGEKYFRDVWCSWVDAMRIIFEKTGGDICKDDLRKIRCPTLYVYGEKDVMVLPEQPHYLKENIKDSKVKIFKNGAHNLHLRYADEFNTLVNQFLTE